MCRACLHQKENHAAKTQDDAKRWWCKIENHWRCAMHPDHYKRNTQGHDWHGLNCIPKTTVFKQDECKNWWNKNKATVEETWWKNQV